MKASNPTKPLSVFDQYIQDVLQNRIPVSTYVRKAVQRHQEDISKKDCLYWFDAATANWVINLFPAVFTLTIGDPEPFVLAPWQAFIVGSVFGWKRKADNLRRFRRAYIQVARKNGKSTLMAGIAILMMLFDNEYSAHVYSLATKKDQARICWNDAVKMVRKSTDLKQSIELYKDSIAVPPMESFFKPLASDVHGLDGLNVHGAIIDEFHEHKTSAVWDVIDTATAARRQPIVWIITTAGSSTASACYQVYTYVTEILNKVKNNDEWFGFVAQLDSNVDRFDDESVWEKANPTIRYNSKLLPALREQCLRATSAQTLNKFKRYCLNQWVGEVDSWLKVDDWNKCKSQFTYDDLKGRPCFGGFDYADMKDLTSLCLVFPPLEDGEKWHYIWQHWLPEETVDEFVLMGDHRFTEWVKSGEIITVPGRSMKLGPIKEYMLQASKDFDLQMIGFDPFHTRSFADEIAEAGIATVKIGQNYSELSEASKHFESQLVDKLMAHNGGSLMRWQAEVVSILQDRKGNVRPTKPVKTANKKKIDGIVASVIAVSVALRNPIQIYRPLRMPTII
jgi:phage terminase large subunit-like protein